MKRLLVIFSIILLFSISSYSQEKENIYSISLLGGPRLFTLNDGKYKTSNKYSNTFNLNGMILLSDCYKKHFKFAIGIGLYTKNFRQVLPSLHEEEYRDYESKYLALQFLYTVLYINNDKFRIGNGISLTYSDLLKMTRTVVNQEWW